MILYFHKECGFSRSVLNTITNLGIADKIDFRNIRENPGYERELVELCGDKQVPTLIVDGAPMRESQDINAFLVDRFF